MGRPIKDGLDYMSLDCDFYTNRKMKLFRSEFDRDDRLKMTMILILIFLRIYDGKGYYIEWDEEEELLFCDEYDVNIQDLKSVVVVALKRGVFSSERFEHKGVLTSAEITSRYIYAKDYRYGGSVDTELGIVLRKTLYPTGLSAEQKSDGDSSADNDDESAISHGETPVNRGIIPISHWKSAQSKVKNKDKKNSPKNNSDSSPEGSSKHCENGHRYVGSFCRQCITESRETAAEDVDDF